MGCFNAESRAEHVIANKTKDEVYEVVKNLAAWGDFTSTFVVHDISPGIVQEGTTFIITSTWADGSKNDSRERIIHMDNEGCEKISWAYAGMTCFVSGAHHITFENTPEGCRLCSWETFSGPIVPLLHAIGMVSKISAGFKQFLVDLDRYLAADES